MAQVWGNLFLGNQTIIFTQIAPMREDIVTGEQFYEYLKKHLKSGQVLYITKDFGKGGGMVSRFSGWEADGRLRFHSDISNIPSGSMRYIKCVHIKTVYNLYEPDTPKKLIQQIKKVCGYRDVRARVLQHLIEQYG